MSSEFLTARQTETVGAILETIRRDPRKRLAIYYVYLVDDHDALVGVATIRQLLAAAPETASSSIMRKKVIRVREDTPIKRLAETFYKYEFTAVPLVDKQNRILGIVTIKAAYESALGRDRERGEEITR
ncbi:MAG: CBS domain-containing protein [Candidatus Aureabacteria bacterium]|nr:CBS domain-containing protein [Candidatus Auribacterota bacterium]